MHSKRKFFKELYHKYGENIAHYSHPEEEGQESNAIYSLVGKLQIRIMCWSTEAELSYIIKQSSINTSRLGNVKCIF